MRISDWSSDVCSSDLLFQQVRRDPFGKRRRQTDIHLAADMRLAKQDALLDLFGQVQDPLRLLEQHQAVLGGDRAARVARSEEHTSELQSLMRISYAVFCLKKKKKHQRTTQQ